MRVLMIGSGGREHALCWKLRQSPLLSALYCAPGNAGIAAVAECVALEGNEAIVTFAREQHIDLVVIGPEGPLVEGLADALRTAGIPAFGPSAQAAQLEGSKGFTKDLCAKYDIPTARYRRFTDRMEAQAYAAEQPLPLVIKADGLAAGKGVVIAATQEEAQQAITEMLDGRFGAAGASLVIEEFMEGEEASFFALSDGNIARAFGAAQDHKRVGEGDTGPNTGGMGTYSPAACFTPAIEERVMREIVGPTLSAMKEEGVPFQGVLFAGLMLTAEGPKLIEYNARFGDPETQVLMLRTEGDLLPSLLACATGTLADCPPVAMKPESAVCVVLAAKGYPEAYEKNTEIRGLERAAQAPHAVVFHAGTAREGERLLSNGGRVLNICATGEDIHAARDAAYHAVGQIDWPQGFCRRDIAWRVLG